MQKFAAKHKVQLYQLLNASGEKKAITIVKICLLIAGFSRMKYRWYDLENLKQNSLSQAVFSLPIFFFFPSVKQLLPQGSSGNLSVSGVFTLVQEGLKQQCDPCAVWVFTKKGKEYWWISVDKFLCQALEYNSFRWGIEIMELHA